jgi:hypothetical protein
MGRSHTVGIIGFGNACYGPWQVLTNIEVELKKQGYGLTFSFLDDPSHAALEEIFAQLETSLT